PRPRPTGAGPPGHRPDAPKTYVAAQLQISPLAATNEIGKDHVITATVKTDNGSGSGLQPASGALVTFSLTNSNGATATFNGGVNTCTTGALGTCSVTINSPTSGTVAIHATTSVTVNGVLLTRATGDGLSGDSSDAGKTYVDAQLQISPLTASNEIGKDHVITATVKTDNGSGSGLQPASGALVTFSLTNSNGATATFNGGVNTPSTAPFRSCSVTINSPTSGTVAIHAT